MPTMRFQSVGARKVVILRCHELMGFLQERETPARAALEALIGGGGARAPEARRLLDALSGVED